MYLSYEEINKHIEDKWLVLDIGGADKVFPRADYVIDLVPYEERNVIYPNEKERFSKDTWLVGDVCSFEFWSKIEDNFFDFTIASHILEDVRDPIFLCSQIIRTSKAGYIEVPSKFLECSRLNESNFFSGYDHHRWIITGNDTNTGLNFKAKLPWVHAEDFLPKQFKNILHDYFYNFDGFFWKGSFTYCEITSKHMHQEVEALHNYFNTECNNYGKEQKKNIINLVEDSVSKTDGTCVWFDQYESDTNSL